MVKPDYTGPQTVARETPPLWAGDHYISEIGGLYRQVAYGHLRQVLLKI